MHSDLGQNYFEAMTLYATNPWSLLQSLACWLLYQEGFVQPVQSNEKP